MAMKPKLLFPVFVSMSLFAPVVALAQKLPNPAPGAGGTLEEFVNLLITIVQWVAIPALAVCIIYAGFILVSAGGNDEQITKGKQWILWTLVGASIILGAHVIADIVFGTAEIF